MSCTPWVTVGLLHKLLSFKLLCGRTVYQSTILLGVHAHLWGGGRPDAQITFKLLRTTTICGSTILLVIHVYRYTCVVGCGAGTQVAV